MGHSIMRRSVVLGAVIWACGMSLPLPWWERVWVRGAEAAEYVVGPGDVLKIDAYEAEKISGRFAVDPKGFITHFVLGRVKVGGKTALQITNDLTAILSRGFLKDPKLTVTVDEYHSQEVYVFGEVAKPGPYGLRGENLLLDVLLLAGGPTPSAGDIVSILRRNADAGAGLTATAGSSLTHLTVNVTRLLMDGELSQNIPVRRGDIIYIPRSDREIKTFFIVGQVKTPGAYRLKEGYTVLNAILDAGGFTKYAKGNGTKLIRGKRESQETFVLKMEDVMDGGERGKDMALKDGDLIVVPAGLF